MRLAALALLFASAAGAQQIVQGRVTDRTSGVPVAGVVVTALDATGASIARTVTDSASGYRMPVMAGMVKLHFRRIGFSPATVAITDSVNGRIDVVLNRLPTVLPPVKSMASQQCDAEANTGEALSLWEEARAGLLTALVARDERTAFISVLVYQTDFDGDDEGPRSVQRHQMADVSHAFTSGDPKTIARRGYYDGSAYIGPDENVLSDESFLSTHCFRVGAAPDDSSVALEFSPAKDRKVPEIEGTVVLGRNPLDLHSIEYRYTNIGARLERGKSGGSIRFRRMPNGITMVQEWRVRSAWLSQRTALQSAMRATVHRGGNQRTAPRSVPRDAALTVTQSGAIIELMQWPGAPAFLAPLATVSGVAIDKHSKTPLRNTPVRLYRTPFMTTTDSTGAFTMIDVLPGVYQADVGDPLLEPFGAAGDLIGPVAVKFGENKDVRLEGEGAEAASVRGCSDKVEGRYAMSGPLRGQRAVFGVIMLDDRAAGGREFRAQVYPPGMVAGSEPFTIKGKTDKAGLFRLCDMPQGTIKILSDDRHSTGAAEAVLDAVTWYRIVGIKLERRP